MVGEVRGEGDHCRSLRALEASTTGLLTCLGLRRRLRSPYYDKRDLLYDKSDLHTWPGLRRRLSSPYCAISFFFSASRRCLTWGLREHLGSWIDASSSDVNAREQ
jgi:hypothetical protein